MRKFKLRPLPRLRFVVVAIAAAGLGLLGGWLTAPIGASADHSFNNENWNSCAGGNGCIGWKQFAVSGTSLGVAHMDNGGSGCGGSVDTGWANGIVYWNGTGTVASFQFPVSDCTPQSFPTVRVIPFTTYDSGNNDWGWVMNYDRLPNQESYVQCLSSCDEAAGGYSQEGYDLSYIWFNTAHSPNWTWVAKHEIGHVLGLGDHSCGYDGLMDTDACTQRNATAAELDEVDTIHDH